LGRSGTQGRGGAARSCAREAAGRSRSGLRPPCGSRPAEHAGGREVAERRAPEGGEERTGAEQSTSEGGMEAGEGGDRGRAGRDGGRGWRPEKEGTGGLVEEDERKKERSKQYVCH